MAMRITAKQDLEDKKDPIHGYASRCQAEVQLYIVRRIAHRLGRHAGLERRRRERQVHVVALPAVCREAQLAAHDGARPHHQRLLQHAPQLEPAMSQTMQMPSARISVW